MNMLPINSEWKRRIKWVEKQREKQKLADKPKGQIKKHIYEKTDPVQEE